MKLAIWQARADMIEPDTVLERIADRLRAAAHAGASMLIVPELVFPGYNRADVHATRAESLNGEFMAAVGRMTHQTGCGLTLGWAERDGKSVYNAATAIDARGRRLSHYRKRALYGDMEAKSFAPGEGASEIFDLGPHRTALLICYDVEFPSQALDLGRRGADLLLVPTANPAGFERVQELIVPARAYDNRQTIAYANYCGTDHGLAFGGGSVIAGPDGGAIIMAGRSEALMVAEIPPLADYPEAFLSQTSRS